MELEASKDSFIKASWGIRGMSRVSAGGSSYHASGLTVDGYKRLALSDRSIVALEIHPDSISASFYTFLGGTASPSSLSWPTYIREDLFNPSWKKGSFVELGDRKIQAQAPTRKPHIRNSICVRNFNGVHYQHFNGIKMLFLFFSRLTRKVFTGHVIRPGDYFDLENDTDEIKYVITHLCKSEKMSRK